MPYLMYSRWSIKVELRKVENAVFERNVRRATHGRAEQSRASTASTGRDRGQICQITYRYVLRYHTTRNNNVANPYPSFAYPRLVDLKDVEVEGVHIGKKTLSAINLSITPKLSSSVRSGHPPGNVPLHRRGQQNLPHCIATIRCSGISRVRAAVEGRQGVDLFVQLVCRILICVYKAFAKHFERKVIFIMYTFSPPGENVSVQISFILQWTIVTNFFRRFRNFEAGYRAEQAFGQQMEK